MRQWRRCRRRLLQRHLHGAHLPDGDAHADPAENDDADRRCDHQRHAGYDRDAYGDADEYRHRGRDAHGHLHRDAHRDPYADEYADANADRDADRDADPVDIAERARDEAASASEEPPAVGLTAGSTSGVDRGDTCREPLTGRAADLAASPA